MPAAATVCGGIDALAHTIEILVGTANNEYTNQILFLCLNKIWRWLPVAVKEPENLEAREQMSWAAHNALANGGVPNGHAVAHAIGSLYHITHGNACAMVLPTVVRHFALYAQKNIQKMAEIMGINVTGDALKDADAVANAIHVFCQELGLDTLQKIFAEKGYCDNCREFTEKMIPQYKIDFFEINVEESDAAGFASAAQAYYNTKTDEHILRICKSSEIPRYIVFHEFTHILDTEMYAKQDSWKYMALSGYTEYHAAQVELMIMLGADSIQTQDFSFTVDVEIGNSTVRNYLNSRHQLVVNMMNRTDFPRDIEALKTTVGVLYNYFGVRSICKMYAKDYTEEVDNTIIIQKLSKVLFEEINSFMVGWFNEAQVELSFVSYMKIMWPMLQSYFGKE